MTVLRSSVSLRHAALAVTTITVAFAAGDARDVEATAGDASLTTADAPGTLVAQRADFAGPVYEPYADPSARRNWVSTIDPAPTGLEARAQGYVVQVGAFAPAEGLHQRGELFTSGASAFAMSMQRVEGAQLGVNPLAGARIVLG